MQENIKLIDLIIELVDARVPLASRNPDIDELGKGKSRIVLLNKSDLADEGCNKAWMRYFEDRGVFALEVNSKPRGLLPWKSIPSPAPASRPSTAWCRRPVPKKSQGTGSVVSSTVR